MSAFCMVCCNTMPDALIECKYLGCRVRHINLAKDGIAIIGQDDAW